MRTERGVGSRVLATTSPVRNLDVDKVGTVVVMVITVVERIKARGSRWESAQISKENVKAMSGQLGGNVQ